MSTPEQLQSRTLADIALQPEPGDNVPEGFVLVEATDGKPVAVKERVDRALDVSWIDGTPKMQTDLVSGLIKAAHTIDQGSVGPSRLAYNLPQEFTVDFRDLNSDWVENRPFDPMLLVSLNIADAADGSGDSVTVVFDGTTITYRIDYELADSIDDVVVGAVIQGKLRGTPAETVGEVSDVLETVEA